MTKPLTQKSNISDFISDLRDLINQYESPDSDHQVDITEALDLEDQQYYKDLEQFSNDLKYFNQSYNDYLSYQEDDLL